MAKNSFSFRDHQLSIIVVLCISIYPLHSIVYIQCLAHGIETVPNLGHRYFFSLFLETYWTDSFDFHYLNVKFDADSEFFGFEVIENFSFLPLPVLLKIFQMVISPKLLDRFGSFLISKSIFYCCILFCHLKFSSSSGLRGACLARH